MHQHPLALGIQAADVAQAVEHSPCSAVPTRYRMDVRIAGADKFIINTVILCQRHRYSRHCRMTPHGFYAVSDNGFTHEVGILLEGSATKADTESGSRYQCMNSRYRSIHFGPLDSALLSGTT